jgi:Zn-dependent protease with chaperone function
MITKEYNALLYRNNSAVAEIVTLSTDKFSLKIKNGSEIQPFPISGIDFQLGGEDSKFLVAKTKEFSLFIKDTDIFDELIKNANAAQAENLSRLKKQSEKKRNRLKLLPVYFLGIIAAFLVVLYLSFQVFTDMIAQNIPVSWEKAIGNAGLAAMIQGKNIDNQALVKPVADIGRYLAGKGNNDEYQFKFYVIRDDEINAFALPGGNVVVHSGLLKNSDSPEEVAGVLAHEIQHVYQKHGMKRIVKRFGISIFLSMLFGSVGSTLDAIGGDLAGLKFDRDEESEADRLGMDLLFNAGVDPHGMVKFFKKLQEKDKNLPQVMSFLSTHPSTADRIEVLQNLADTRYKNLPYKKDFKIDWKKVKETAKNQ